jgi:HEAT repeat protein
MLRRAANVILGLVAVLAVNLPAVVPCQAQDWAAFDNPESLLLTDAFAKSIADLPADEQAAATKRLQGSLESKVFEIRRRAALTLDKLGDKSGVPTMIADLATAAGNDKQNVVVALRILKDERAIPALRKALTDRSPYVRSIAVSALGELQAVEAYDEIVGLTGDLGDPPAARAPGTLDCFPVHPGDSACYALGALGQKKAVPVLIARLADKHFRQSASQALAALSGEKFGTDAAKWSQWWKEQSR